MSSRICSLAIGYETPVLDGESILVVEDDPFIALGIEATLEESGATIVGPAFDVGGAFHLLEEREISAAVLDYRLRSGTSVPIAEALIARRIPFVLQTSDPQAAARENLDAPIISKPYPAIELTLALKSLLLER